jgi:hypothetical protein
MLVHKASRISAMELSVSNAGILELLAGLMMNWDLARFS